MKKIVLSIAVLILMLFPASAETVRIAAMRGPTAMGLCGLMREAENGPVNGISYEFTLEGSPDAVVPLVVRGDVDIAAIPANLASVLYNRTGGKIEALAINTLGVLYIGRKMVDFFKFMLSRFHLSAHFRNKFWVVEKVFTHLNFF